MFTVNVLESVRVGCDFLACRVESAKNQTCLIFHRPSKTLDPGSAQLETCPSHFPSFKHSNLVLMTSSLVLITSGIVLS